MEAYIYKGRFSENLTCDRLMVLSFGGTVVSFYYVICLKFDIYLIYSIFKDNSVISSIPNYFNNPETPIICYKYNKPIRSTIFNFNKIVNDLDIDSNTPAS